VQLLGSMLRNLQHRNGVGDDLRSPLLPDLGFLEELDRVDDGVDQLERCLRACHVAGDRVVLVLLLHNRLLQHVVAELVFGYASEVAAVAGDEFLDERGLEIDGRFLNALLNDLGGELALAELGDMILNLIIDTLGLVEGQSHDFGHDEVAELGLDVVEGSL